MANNKNIIVVIIITIVILILTGVGIGIYFVTRKNSIELYNIKNYTDKSIWRVNTTLKPEEERVSPDGQVKIYVKLEDRTNTGDNTKWLNLWRKNPNKIGKYGSVDVGNISLMAKQITQESIDGVTLTSTGTDINEFYIETVTKNNKTYYSTYDGDIENSSTSLYRSYFDDNGIPLGKIRMDNNTTAQGFILKTNDIDYILVRNDAILIFDKNNKLLGILG